MEMLANKTFNYFFLKSLSSICNLPHVQWQRVAILFPRDQNGSGWTDTFFAHSNTEALLQSTVLALVPVVLVNLTLSVWPENINISLWDYRSGFQKNFTDWIRWFCANALWSALTVRVVFRFFLRMIKIYPDCYSKYVNNPVVLHMDENPLLPIEWLSDINIA